MKEETKPEISPEEYIYAHMFQPFDFMPGNVVRKDDALEAIRLTRLENESKIKEIREEIVKAQKFFKSKTLNVDDKEAWSYFEGKSDASLTAIAIIDKHLNS